MMKYDQCEHRLECGACIKAGKLCPHLPQIVNTEQQPPCIEPLPLVEWSENVSNDLTPECCKFCPNHPANGGSGICNCVLPYMSLSSIGGTYTVDSSQKYNGNNTVIIPYRNSQTEYDSGISNTYTGIKK